jgi:hypothetical protein
MDNFQGRPDRAALFLSGVSKPDVSKRWRPPASLFLVALRFADRGASGGDIFEKKKLAGAARTIK